MFSQPHFENKGEEAYHALSAFFRSGGTAAPPPAEFAQDLANLDDFYLVEELDKLPCDAQTKRNFEKIRKTCLDLKLVANEDDFDAAWVVDSNRFEWYASNGKGNGVEKIAVLLYGFEQHASNYGVISNVYRRFPSLKNPIVSETERNEHLRNTVFQMNNPDAIRHIVNTKCDNPATAWDALLPNPQTHEISTTAFCCALLEKKINLVDDRYRLHDLFHTVCTSEEDTRMIHKLLEPCTDAKIASSDSHHHLRGVLLFPHNPVNLGVWKCTVSAIFDLYRRRSRMTLPHPKDTDDASIMHKAYREFVEPRLDFFAMCGVLARDEMKFVHDPKARNSWEQFKSMFRCYLNRDNTHDSSDAVMRAVTSAPSVTMLSEAVLSATEGKPMHFEDAHCVVLFMEAFNTAWARKDSCGLYVFMRDTAIPMFVAYWVHKNKNTHLNFGQIFEKLKDATTSVVRTYMD